MYDFHVFLSFQKLRSMSYGDKVIVAVRVRPFNEREIGRKVGINYPLPIFILV